MLKTFLISIILLLTSAIACGQHLTPKRIVFSGDTGIFFTHKQEIELLVKFKQFEGCKLEIEKWKKAGKVPKEAVKHLKFLEEDLG